MTFEEWFARDTVGYNAPEHYYLARTAWQAALRHAIPEGHVVVPMSAVKLAWKIAKTRRDELFQATVNADYAEDELRQLAEAGFAKHLPTLEEVRAEWRGETLTREAEGKP